MGIHKHEVTILLMVTWQEVVPLLANKSYSSFKMNINFRNPQLSFFKVELAFLYWFILNL